MDLIKHVTITIKSQGIVWFTYCHAYVSHFGILSLEDEETGKETKCFHFFRSCKGRDHPLLSDFSTVTLQIILIIVRNLNRTEWIIGEV